MNRGGGIKIFVDIYLAPPLNFGQFWGGYFNSQFLFVLVFLRSMYRMVIFLGVY